MKISQKNCKFWMVGALASTMAILPSCSGIIDLEPINSTFNEAFWKTQKDAEQGMAGAYALLRRALHGGYNSTSFFAYGDIAGKEFSNLGGDFDHYVLNQINNLEFNGPAGYVEPFMDWTPYYKVISQCNLLLDRIPTVPEAGFTDDQQEVKDQLMGETYFIRAFTYFYLTRLWKNVPLVLELEDPLQADYKEQAPASQIIAQCLEDAGKAIELLDWEYSSPQERAVRANKGAAYALLAHIYMWTGEAEEAEQAADEVITQGPYELVDSADYQSVFQGKSLEGIFEIARDFSFNEASGGGFMYLMLKDPYIRNKTAAAIVNKSLVEELYTDAHDMRLSRFFAFMNTNDPICIKYSNVIYEDPAAFTGISINNNLIVFRLGGIILLRAEALAKLGRYQEARALLKRVTDRAGTAEFAGTDPELYEFIIDERTRELFAEGHRYFDIVRSGFLDQKLGMTGDRISQDGYYWPISPGLANDNRKLQQVRYWENKI